MFILLYESHVLLIWPILMCFRIVMNALVILLLMFVTSAHNTAHFITSLLLSFTLEFLPAFLEDAICLGESL